MFQWLKDRLRMRQNLRETREKYENDILNPDYKYFKTKFNMDCPKSLRAIYDLREVLFEPCEHEFWNGFRKHVTGGDPGWIAPLNSENIEKNLKYDGDYYWFAIEYVMGHKVLMKIKPPQRGHLLVEYGYGDCEHMGLAYNHDGWRSVGLDDYDNY